MQELLAKVGYPLCDPGQLRLGFLPVIGARLLAVQRFISSSILLLSLDNSTLDSRSTDRPLLRLHE